MKQENKVFALLGGILIVTGLIYPLIMNIRNLVRYFHSLNLLALLANILFLGVGVLLILRNIKVSSILQAAAAGLMLVAFMISLVSTINMLQYRAPNIYFYSNIPFYLMFTLFAVALFIKKTPALVLAICAAACRLLSQILLLVFVGGKSTVLTVLNTLSILILSTGIVFIGLYLKDRPAAPAKAAPGYHPGYIPYGQPMYPQGCQQPQNYQPQYQQPQYQQPQYQQPQYQQPQNYQAPQGYRSPGDQTIGH